MKYEELTDEQKEKLRIVEKYIAEFIKNVWTKIKEVFQMLEKYLDKYNNELYKITLKESRKFKAPPLSVYKLTIPRVPPLNPNYGKSFTIRNSI